MTDFFLPDDVICNITARLPAKALLRFRCVSRHWNRILTEPNFMKLRSRKTIILPLDKTIFLIDDTHNSIVERRYKYPLNTRLASLKPIGTINGIVLLAVLDDLMLYNPFTGAYKMLPYPPKSYHRDAYGLGYGAAPDDLKIVRIRQHFVTCDVYSFREGSWSSWSMSKYINFIKFQHHTGHFVNGFFYWMAYYRSVVIAINVTDMVYLEICLPFETNAGSYINPLGTINGCLSLLNRITIGGYDMWVMNQQNQWSKIYSFELPLCEISSFSICVLDSSRILMLDRSSENLIIYDPSKGSYKTMNMSITSLPILHLDVHALEYVESLVSPSDICF